MRKIGDIYIFDDTVITYDMTLEEAKQKKYEELDRDCNAEILSGFDSDCRGLIKHYAFDSESQLNMAGIQLRIVTEMMLYGGKTVTPIEWKSSDEWVCDNDWTPQQFMVLVATGDAFKTTLIKKNHDLKQYVAEMCDTLEKVCVISWKTDATSLPT